MHFGECRGCQSQDVSYDGQVAAKASLLEEMFSEFWGDSIRVTPSPVIWNYRNKVDPSFAGKHYEEVPPADFVRETVLGFKKRWYWPIEIEECLIGPEGFGELLGAVREWYGARGYGAYDSRREAGLLRHLLVRDAKRTDDKMVVLITTEGEVDCDSFVEAVRGVYPATSIYRGINRSKSDVAEAEEVKLLYGAAEINEHLHIPDEAGHRELAFRISPFSFFQTNPIAAEVLYGLIRDWVKRVSPETLYDLYGGSGGIAFSCADLVGRVCSVESVAEASVDGRHNAEVNGVSNVTFLTEEVQKYLQYQLEAEGLAEDSAVVLDPPRAGLHPKALKRLMKLAPEHILYVSCNPKLLARELPVFLEGYVLESLEAVDMFPHTKHVEVVAGLRRQG